jgi:hypothetical protein
MNLSKLLLFLSEIFVNGRQIRRKMAVPKIMSVYPFKNSGKPESTTEIY